MLIDPTGSPVYSAVRLPRSCDFFTSFFRTARASIILLGLLLASTSLAKATTIFVSAGGDLQAAMNNAQCGDTVELATATFTAPPDGFVGRTKCVANPITVRTSNLANLPSGRQVGIADGANMAKLVTSGPYPAVAFAGGAQGWKFIGLEITTTSNIDFAHYVSTLVNIGRYVSPAPSDITFDRCWIHSPEDGTNSLTTSVKILVDAEGVNLSLLNSRIASPGPYMASTATFDNTAAVMMIDGPGPLKIDNSFLNAWFACFFMGGGNLSTNNTATILPSPAPTLNSAAFSNVNNLNVGDLMALADGPSQGVGGDPNLNGLYYRVAKVTGISGNIVNFIPWAGSLGNIPGCTGSCGIPLSGPPVSPGGARWNGTNPGHVTITHSTFWINPTVAAQVAANTGRVPKGFFEIKSVDSLYMEGNNFTGWPATFALTQRNQTGQNGGPSPWSIIRNVTIRSNRFNTSPFFGAQLFTFLLEDNEGTSVVGGNILIENNLFTSGGWVGDFYSGNGITIRHNTILNNIGWANGRLLNVNYIPISAFALNDNIVFNNEYGLNYISGGSISGLAMNGNVLITGTVDPYRPNCFNVYPAGNFCPASQNELGFVDATNGNYRLSPTSIYRNRASDGTDPGINQDVLEAALAGGTTTPSEFTLSGHLTYANGTTPGRNVTMTLTAPSFTSRQTTTDVNGDYLFANVPGGNDYTVTPSKAGGINGLQSFDASFVTRFSAGLDVPTAIQRIAADADGDNILTSLDASYIARRAAGLSGTGIVGTWKFSPATRVYPALNGDQISQGFTAILVGELSGDWTPMLPSDGNDEVGAGAGNAQIPNATLAVNVSLPHVPGAMGSVISVPITVGDVTGQGVRAYDLQVTFNAAILKPCVANECGGGPSEKPFDKNSTLSQDMTVTANANNTGHLIISAFQTDDVIGSGTLINLRFHVVGAQGQNSPLTFEDYTDPNPTFHPGFRFNAGNPQAATSNGSVTVNGPTAAASRLTGRVTDGNGQPVAGTTVTVNGGASIIRAITNRDGYYQVEELETNGFYTVTPTRANFVFAPANRSFSLVGDRTDAVFTGAAIGSDNANPLESPEFFVRQQYLDFLGREPEQGGLDYWSGQLRACGEDENCVKTRRLDISAAFFIAEEFQQAGLFIFDLYKGALGRRPAYAEFAVDRRLVVGGPHLEADKSRFATSFVERAEFTAQYPLTLSGEVYVDALLRTAQQSSGLDLSSERGRLVSLYNSGGSVTESRSQVLRSIVEGAQFKETQYNAGFVLSEYFSYLGRNPDPPGYDFWLSVLNSGEGNNYRGIVCSFITSAEYQRRFSTVVTRDNTECQ